MRGRLCDAAAAPLGAASAAVVAALCDAKGFWGNVAGAMAASCAGFAGDAEAGELFDAGETIRGGCRGDAEGAGRGKGWESSATAQVAVER